MVTGGTLGDDFGIKFHTSGVIQDPIKIMAADLTYVLDGYIRIMNEWWKIKRSGFADVTPPIDALSMHLYTMSDFWGDRIRGKTLLYEDSTVTTRIAPKLSAIRRMLPSDVEIHITEFGYDKHINSVNAVQLPVERVDNITSMTLGDPVKIRLSGVEDKYNEGDYVRISGVIGLDGGPGRGLPAGINRGTNNQNFTWWKLANKSGDTFDIHLLNDTPLNGKTLGWNPFVSNGTIEKMKPCIVIDKQGTAPSLHSYMMERGYYTLMALGFHQAWAFFYNDQADRGQGKVNLAAQVRLTEINQRSGSGGMTE